MQRVQKIIIGLGNPGVAYQHSRHNAGFMVLDALAEKLDCSFTAEPKHVADIAHCGSYTLIKPLTFMNDSGKAARSWLAFYKLLESELGLTTTALVYDDLDISFGSWKWLFGKSPKAHNGVNSVISHLGTDQFWHCRIGVENRDQRGVIPSDRYVLSAFTELEKPSLLHVIDQAVQQLTKDW